MARPSSGLEGGSFARSMAATGGRLALHLTILAFAGGCGGKVIFVDSDGGASGETSPTGDSTNDGASPKDVGDAAPLDCGNLPVPYIPARNCKSDSECVAYYTPYLTAVATGAVATCGADGACYPANSCKTGHDGIQDCLCGSVANCGGAYVCATVAGQSGPQCIPSRCYP